MHKFAAADQLRRFMKSTVCVYFTVDRMPGVFVLKLEFPSYVKLPFQIKEGKQVIDARKWEVKVLNGRKMWEENELLCLCHSAQMSVQPDQLLNKKIVSINVKRKKRKKGQDICKEKHVEGLVFPQLERDQDVLAY